MILFYRGIPVDVDVPGRLADNLLAGTGFFGDKNQQISADFCHAGQAKTLILLRRGKELVFLFLPFARMRPTRMDAEFFVEPFFNSDFALSTDFLFSTEGLNVHSQLLGRLNEIGSMFDQPAAGRRLEDHHVLPFVHSALPLFPVSCRSSYTSSQTPIAPPATSLLLGPASQSVIAATLLAGSRRR
jgi:hypothetical protein